MEPVLPPDIDPDAFLGFSALPAAALIAGMIQAFVKSGLPVRHASLLGIVLGVSFSVIAYASLGGVLIVSITQGLVTGFAGYAAWVHFSNKVNTNGD